MSVTEVGIIFATLTFLPGIGMLIMSTSRRYIELIRQLQRIFDADLVYSDSFMKCQRQRLGMFKWALSLLYISVGLILLGSLLGGISISNQPLSEFLLFSFLVFAVLTDVIAMYLLIKESFVSASLINERFDKHVEEKNSGEYKIS